MKRFGPGPQAALFFAFVCLVIYLANTGHANPIFDAVKAIPFGDKCGHTVLYGLLAFLANRACGFNFVRTSWLQVGSLAVITFAVVEELTQHTNPNRTMDGIDVLADLLGIGLATWISIRVMEGTSSEAKKNSQAL